MAAEHFDEVERFVSFGAEDGPTIYSREAYRRRIRRTEVILNEYRTEFPKLVKDAEAALETKDYPSARKAIDAVASFVVRLPDPDRAKEYGKQQSLFFERQNCYEGQHKC